MRVFSQPRSQTLSSYLHKRKNPENEVDFILWITDNNHFDNYIYKFVWRLIMWILISLGIVGLP
jgi:hypothetical protein